MPGRGIAVLKAALFLGCLLPLAGLVSAAFNDTLGANPIEAVTRTLGAWTLNFLLTTLSVAPLRRWSGWVWLARLRRMLGLFTFFYACLHLTSYLWFDQFFDWTDIGGDIRKRPFITAGFAAFVLLLPLAATSTDAMVRYLGRRPWQTLHRASYMVAVLGVLHYAWMVKLDPTLPIVYGLALILLLGMRVLWRNQERERIR